MQYRLHKNLEVSEIGVGCYALSGAYGSPDIDHFQDMVRRAYEIGVTFFDTAEGYGDAERILGNVVKPFRDEICIATKVGIREGVKPNLSKNYIYEACTRSLKQLDTDYIDLYQIHFDDPQTPVSETLEALDTLVSEGKIRAYGVGHLPIHQVKEYCELGSPFSILMELSAVTRKSREELLPFCDAYDVAGIGFSATGRGILSGKYGHDAQFESNDIRNHDPLFQRTRFESALRITDQFAKLAEDYGVIPVQIAIAWVLAQPNIVCALTGSSKIEHLEENVGASGLTIKRKDLEKLEDLFIKEDGLLAEKDRQIIHSILSNPLSSDPNQAFNDLIYVIETGTNMDMLSEDSAFSVLTDLWPLKKKLDGSNLSKLADIQERLKTLIQVTGPISKKE
ncbi:MAG: aldo/keto reductase [Candidatus Thorarchaeota archaeon]|nr:aldo/keto reductase [Candidatus Thorarchaeota archaeon]